MALKADVKLSAVVAMTMVANTPQTVVSEIATLSDAASYQVLDIIAVELIVGGTTLIAPNPITVIAQICADPVTDILVPGDASLYYQLGQQFPGDGALQLLNPLTVQTMIAGEKFDLPLWAVSVAAGTFKAEVNVYGNYRKLSEVDYLRLTCA